MQGSGAVEEGHGGQEPRRFLHPVLPVKVYPDPGTPAFILQEARARMLRRVREAEEEAARLRAELERMEEQTRLKRLRSNQRAGSPIAIRRRRDGDIVVTPAWVTVESIARLVARRHRLTLADLQGNLRARHIAWPRQQVMYLAREAGFSWPHIAKALGGRDHTTVMHGYQAVAERLLSHQPTLDAILAAKAEMAGALS